MQEVHYFNTTSLSGEDLKQAVIDAANQEDAILLIYQATGKPYTPSAILGMTTRAGHKWPITSIRRSISNLTDRKELVMLPNTKEGLYGKHEHYWKANKIKPL
jgi:hypothetical protein